MSLTYGTDNSGEFDYQTEAMRTRGEFTDFREQMKFAMLEIAAESGELANLVYKYLYQGHPFSRKAFLEETGDMLWGIACLMDAIDAHISEAEAGNIAKLRKRYASGRFTVAESIARVDHAEPLEDAVVTEARPVINLHSQPTHVRCPLCGFTELKAITRDGQDVLYCNRCGGTC